MSRKYRALNQKSYKFVFDYIVDYDKPFGIIELTRQINDEYVFCDFNQLKKSVIDTIQELLDKGIIRIRPDDKYELTL